jgi:glycosyltransferase involved in cell wall biosynthesis
VAALAGHGHDVELLIVGEGDQQAALQGLIEELGVGGRARLLGYRPDLKEVYQALDVFALSSIRGGLPNVLLEAMALGVPVVATRIAGIPRLVRDGENGLLVEPGDPESLGRAIDRLRKDRGLRDRLRHSGRRTIEAG